MIMSFVQILESMFVCIKGENESSKMIVGVEILLERLKIFLVKIITQRKL